MDLINEIRNALKSADVIIESYYEGNSFVLIKYNSYTQSEYIQQIDILFENFKQKIDEVLPESELERMDKINYLLDELEPVNSFFIKRNGYLNHVNLSIKYIDSETGKTAVVENDEYNDEIQVFISYQNLLQKKIVTYLNTLNTSISESFPHIKGRNEKIVWKGKVSQFGYIFLELINKGYIQPPKKSGGEINYSRFARICFDVFEIKTTQSTLIKELSDRQNSLDSYNKNQFEIPYESKLIIPDKESLS